MMKDAMFPLLLLFAAGLADARQSFPVSELAVDGIYATKTGDHNLYCLLGANTCLLWGLHNPWTDDTLIADWLAAHPKATATPVSSRNWTLGNRQHPQHRVYLWIEDSGVSLNVALVREGHYVAAAMKDMVEADREMAGMGQKTGVAQDRSEKREKKRTDRLESSKDLTAQMPRER